MKSNKIDYTKLNKRIVDQAYTGMFVLTNQQKQQLIEDKFARARQYSQALKNSPVTV